MANNVTWPTDFGDLTPPIYRHMFGNTKLERGVNMFINNHITHTIPDLLNNRVFYVILSQTFPITGVTHVVEWHGFINNSMCTCTNYLNTQECKHLYCVRMANM
jgi:hypothetical protein